MGKQLFANNASALLAASIDDNDLTIQVESGYGARFPNPGAGEEFVVSLINAAGDIEYCRITSRATDLLTVASGGRGYDGSSAQAWTNGQTRVEYRLTKKIMEEFIQRSGDAMSGDLDMDENDLKDAHVTGAATLIDGGQIVGVPLRGTADDSSNEIAVPSDGSRATSGGSAILTEGDDEGVATAAFAVGMIMMWYGAAVDCPDGWAICNGGNGTPDLRDRLPIGVGTTAATVGATGGAASSAGGVTGAAGAHTHTTTTGDHTLTVDEMPSHSHRAYMNDTSCSGSGKALWALDNSPSYHTTSSNSGGQPLIEATGGGQPHSHPGGSTNDPGNHTHTTPAVATLPPYLGLHFIMFIGF